MNLKAAALKFSQSEEGEEGEDDFAIDRRQGDRELGLSRAAGARHGAAEDLKGTSTRNFDVEIIFARGD